MTFPHDTSDDRSESELYISDLEKLLADKDAIIRSLRLQLTEAQRLCGECGAAVGLDQEHAPDCVAGMVRRAERAEERRAELVNELWAIARTGGAF